MNGHRASIKVLSIMNEQGQQIIGEAAVHKEAIQYFQQFLGSDINGNDQCTNRPASIIEWKLTTQQQQLLDADVTREKIKLAMFSIGNGKAPGPDCFSVGFSNLTEI